MSVDSATSTPAPASAPTARPTVVFIAGGGRSGTTLIGNAIGSLTGALSVGEVRMGMRRGILEGGHCGCRLPVTTCPVWAPAMEQTFGAIPSVSQATEIEDALAQTTRTRQVPRWLVGRAPEGALELSRILGRLLTSVAEVSGASVIVDSSKYPAYGALLAVSGLVDVRTVHVMRDPRAVAWSWQRLSASHTVQGFEEEMEMISPAKSSLMWLASGASIPALDHARGRVQSTRPMDVHYEDFVARPAEVLDRVAAFAGLQPDPTLVGEDGLHLRTSHAIAGNPNRVRTGPVALHADDEWQRLMPAASRQLVGALTAPMRWRHGY